MIITTGLLNFLRGRRLIEKDGEKILSGAFIYTIAFGLYFWLMTGMWWSILVGAALFVLGERPSWGMWVSALVAKEHPGERLTDWKESSTGKSYPFIYYIVEPMLSRDKHFLWHCVTSLALRGAYWWAPSMIALCVFGVVGVIPCIIASLMLSVCFPLSCILSRYVSIGTLSGWKTAEVLYGMMQGYVFFALFILENLNFS